MREGEEGWGKGGLRTKVAELLNPPPLRCCLFLSPFTVWRHIDPKPKEQPQATEAAALPRELSGRKKEKEKNPGSEAESRLLLLLLFPT